MRLSISASDDAAGGHFGLGEAAGAGERNACRFNGRNEVGAAALELGSAQPSVERRPAAERAARPDGAEGVRPGWRRAGCLPSAGPVSRSSSSSCCSGEVGQKVAVDVAAARVRQSRHAAADVEHDGTGEAEVGEEQRAAALVERFSGGFRGASSSRPTSGIVTPRSSRTQHRRWSAAPGQGGAARSCGRGGGPGIAIAGGAAAGIRLAAGGEDDLGRTD